MGSLEDQRKCHFVSWGKLCLPKARRGMGFHDLYQFNRALIMKLGWGIIKCPKALLVQVLHNKYKCANDVVLGMREFTTQFDTWRGIMST